MKIKTTLLILFGLEVFCLGLFPTLDPDLGIHLKTGELILKHGIPHADVFSFTALGAPWMVHEWLCDIFLRILYNFFGFSGLMIVFAALAVLISALVYLTCAGQPILALPLTLLSFLSAKFVWGSRPQIFNLLMLAIYMAILRGVRRRTLPWKWVYAFPFLAMLWVNMHSGHLIGLAVLTVVLVGDFIQNFLLHAPEPGIFEAREIKPFSIIVVLSAIAGLCNPEGYRIYLYPFKILGGALYQTSIHEWISHDFHNPLAWGFLTLMALGAVSFLGLSRRTHLSDLCLYVGTMVAGLMSRRHSPLFSIVASPIISQVIWDSVTSAKWRDLLECRTGLDRLRVMRFFINPLLILFALTGTCTWTASRIRQNQAEMESFLPVGAVQFIKEHGLKAKRVFNLYDWGGYLVLNDIPVFIDGRAEVYGPRFLEDYFVVADLRKGVEGVQYAIDRWGIEYFLVPSGWVLASALRTNLRWKEVYRGGPASIFLKKDIAGISGSKANYFKIGLSGNP